MKDDQVKHLAFKIHQEKKRLGIPSSPEKDWEEAKEQLRIHRGEVGQ